MFASPELIDIMLQEKASTTANPIVASNDPKMRSGSITAALETSRMMGEGSEEAATEKHFSGTIWDSPINEDDATAM